MVDGGGCWEEGSEEVKIGVDLKRKKGRKNEQISFEGGREREKERENWTHRSRSLRFSFLAHAFRSIRSHDFNEALSLLSIGDVTSVVGGRETRLVGKSPDLLKGRETTRREIRKSA